MMFLLAVLGNVTYGFSILVRNLDGNYVLKHLPWLVGSLGVVFLDLAVSFQIYKLHVNALAYQSMKSCKDELFMIIEPRHEISNYSRLSLTQLCITQYYHLSQPDGPVPVFSPIYYCNSTTFISTTAMSIKLITRYEIQVPLINFSEIYNG